MGGRRWGAFVGAVLGTATLLGGVVAPPAAHAQPASAETQFLLATNRVRAAHGLPALAVRRPLTAVARRWSYAMATSWRLSHNGALPGEVALPWLKLGENVGTGSSVDSIQGAFEASPTHFENILDPAWDSVGIGVVEVGDRIFVTVDFMGTDSASAPPAAPAALGGSPSAGVDAVADAAGAARRLSGTAFDGALGQVRAADVVNTAGPAPQTAGALDQAPAADEDPAGRGSRPARRLALAVLAWLTLSAGAVLLCLPRIRRRPPASLGTSESVVARRGPLPPPTPSQQWVARYGRNG